MSSHAPVQSAPRRVFGRCLLIARIALCSQCSSVCWRIPAKPQRGGGRDDFWEVAQRGRCLYGFTEVYRKPCVELPLFLPPFFPFFPPSDVSQQSLLHLNIGQVDSHWFPQTRSNGSLCRVRNRKITKEKNIKGPLSPTPSDLAPQMYGPRIYKEEVASANIR